MLSKHGRLAAIHRTHTDAKYDDKNESIRKLSADLYDMNT